MEFSIDELQQLGAPFSLRLIQRIAPPPQATFLTPEQTDFILPGQSYISPAQVQQPIITPPSINTPFREEVRQGSGEIQFDQRNQYDQGNQFDQSNQLDQGIQEDQGYMRGVAAFDAQAYSQAPTIRQDQTQSQSKGSQTGSMKVRLPRFSPRSLLTWKNAEHVFNAILVIFIISKLAETPQVRDAAARFNPFRSTATQTTPSKSKSPGSNKPDQQFGNGDGGERMGNPNSDRQRSRQRRPRSGSGPGESAL